MFLTENPFSDHGPNKQGLSESFKYHIPEDIPANERTAFHGAAADAAKKGKKSFNFGGKTHPVTMKKDLANKIADQKEADDYHYSTGERVKKKEKKESVGKTAGDKSYFHLQKAKELAKKDGHDYDKLPQYSRTDNKHKDHYHDMAKKESVKKESTMTFREKLMSLFEGDRAAHYKGATEPEPMHMKSMSSKGAMDMLNTPKSVEADGMKAAKDTADAIKKSAPGKKLRKGDQNKGDLTVKPSATPVKDPSAKMQTAESTVNEDQAYHKSMAAAHGHHGERHSTEAGNSDSSAHDYAANAHDEAERLHKVAHDAHKKHGGDSKQYKSAADAAHKQSTEAHDNTKDAGRFKAIDKPSMKMFPKKPSMKKEDYGISGNKVSNTLLDAIEQVTKGK